MRNYNLETLMLAFRTLHDGAEVRQPATPSPASATTGRPGDPDAAFNRFLSVAAPNVTQRPR